MPVQGRSLQNAIANLGLRDNFHTALAQLGINLEECYESVLLPSSMSFPLTFCGYVILASSGLLDVITPRTEFIAGTRRGFGQWRVGPPGGVLHGQPREPRLPGLGLRPPVRPFSLPFPPICS
jgi:hypothetical protein